MNPLHFFIFPFIPSITLKRLDDNRSLSTLGGISLFFIGLIILMFFVFLALYLDGGHRFDEYDIQKGKKVCWNGFYLVLRSGLQLYFINRILTILKAEFSFQTLLYVYGFSLLPLVFEIAYGRVIFNTTDEMSLFGIAWFTLILFRGILHILNSDIVKSIVVVFGSFFMTFFFEWVFRELYGMIFKLFQ